MPITGRLQDRWQAWVRGGALASEMEAAVLYVLARVLGCRAGGLMINGGTHQDLTNLISTAVDGLKLLITRDRQEQ